MKGLYFFTSSIPTAFKLVELKASRLYKTCPLRKRILLDLDKENHMEKNKPLPNTLKISLCYNSP